MTKDGRQVIGSAVTDASLLGNTLTTGNGFAAGATYSTAYLNKSGTTGYKGMTVFYGAQAAAQVQPIYNPDGTISTKTKNFPALLQGDRITAMSTATLTSPAISAGSVIAIAGGVQTGNRIQVPVANLNFTTPKTLSIDGVAVNVSAVASAQDIATAINNTASLNSNTVASVAADGSLVIATKGLPAGSFKLNGVELGALNYPTDGTNLKPSAIAAWINLKTPLTGVTANASNTIIVDAAQVKFGLPLYINGAAVNTGSAVTLADLASAINNSNAGVNARVDAEGKLAISNGGTSKGDEVTIAGSTVTGSTAQNALGLTTGVYRGTVSLTQPITDAAVVAVSQLGLTNPLCINGVQISNGSSAGGPANALDMVTAINANSAQSNVQARLSSDQSQLILSNVPGAQGATITVSRGPLQPDVAPGSYITQGANALALNNGVLPGPEVANLASVQLGFGTGTPADLLKMGFRTGAFIKGPVKDDLLVFVSGSGAAMVSASYAGRPANAREALRSNPMTVTFTDDTHYKIVDNATNTVLAERVLDPLQLNPGIRYQGLSLSFTAAPKATDTFTLDGNTDGVGNNDNMIAISALETKAVVGKKTLSNAYIDQINEMGNIARQATISQTALTVVHDQAVKSRDTISGVSLDQEAADLIRYQQAYQASAKTLQIAGQLFDTVLHVN